MNTSWTVHRDPAAPTHSSPERLSVVGTRHLGSCRRRGGRCIPSVLLWLHSAAVYACGLILIASVDIAFSVAGGRANVIAVEAAVTTTDWAAAVAVVAAAIANRCRSRMTPEAELANGCVHSG